MELTNQSLVPMEIFVRTGYTPVSGSFSQSALSAISTSRSLNLNLVTAEGDTVTLSTSARSAAVYADAETVSVDGSDNYRYQQETLAAAAYQFKVDLSVEGDLNSEEQREIRQVIQTLNKMMHQYLQGHQLPDPAGIEKLTGMETIARLDARFSYEHTVMTARQTSAAVVYDQTGAVTPGSGHTFGMTDMQDEQTTDAVDSIADDMARHVKAAKAPWRNKLRAVNHLFAAHRDRADAKDDNRGVSRLERLQRRFMAALESLRDQDVNRTDT